MKLNCEVGDLAVIVSDHKQHPGTAGLLCDVLYQSPHGDFDLPDGVPTRSTCSGPAWVIKLHRPVQVLWRDGVMRPASYASCPDAKLRPIRDQPGEDESLSWADVPTKETV